MMRLQSYLALINLLAIASSLILSGTHSGSPPNSVYSNTYPFAGSSTNKCKIKLAIAAFPKPSAILYASATNANPLSTNTKDYRHINPTDNAYLSYDLQNAITGKDQTVWITSLTPVIIDIKVLLTSTLSHTFTITITEQIFATSCLNPLSPLSNLYCSSCSGTSGAYCNYYDVALSNNTQRTVILPSGGYIAFTIPTSSNTITLNFGADQSYAEVIVQFKAYSGESAGLINAAPTTSGGEARYPTIDAFNIYQVTINSGSSDISVGVINQSPSTMSFNIWYTTQQTVNILIIILGVLGGILLIVLIIAACCIIKRMRNPSQIIHPNSSAILHQVRIQQNMLTSQEIEMYFPSVSCRIVFGDLQTSAINLNNQQEQNIDKDCVICLCPVDINELMKVTYCRHIFHSHCLVEWFKKQRNCPYCREEYSKSSTIDHYQHLLKDTKRNILAGAQLAQAIIKSKLIKSSLVIQQMKD